MIVDKMEPEYIGGAFPASWKLNLIVVASLLAADNNDPYGYHASR